MKFKKYFALLLTCVAITGQAMPTFAQTTEATQEIQTSIVATTTGSTENIGVTTEAPSMIQSRSTSKPSSSHNIATKGTMSIYGQAAYDDLYTNKYFTGKTSYSIYVYNEKGYTDYLSFSIYRSDGTFIDSFSVQGQTGKTISLTNASTSSKYYLKFEAPCHFSGSIS